jgi:hypothetical protein
MMASVGWKLAGITGKIRLSVASPFCAGKPESTFPA